MGLGFPTTLVDLIDERIARSRRLTRKVGTFLGVDNGYALVAFDGSSTGLPCLYLANVNLNPNARVIVDMYGSEWVVTGAFQSTSPWPIVATELTQLTGFTNTGASNGSPVVEIEFDAPPSGGVYLTVGGQLSQTVDQNMTVLSSRTVQGNDYASGVQIQGFDYRRSVVAGRSRNASANAESGGTFRWPLQGLVPGSHYVVRTGHWTTPAGSGNINARYLMAEPIV